MPGNPEDKIAAQRKMIITVTVKMIFLRSGLSGRVSSSTFFASTRFDGGFIRCGNSGGRKAKIITQAESATPMPTSEPSWARPGKPPKFKTRKAEIVVTAAQKMLGAIARRISGMDSSGCASASW